MNIAEDLLELQEAKDQGLISEEEFAASRQEIVGNFAQPPGVAPTASSSNDPPPGAVYMRNGVWMDNRHRPIPATLQVERRVKFAANATNLPEPQENGTKPPGSLTKADNREEAARLKQAVFRGHKSK